jgi:A/G-specific adenine glycosylase
MSASLSTRLLDWYRQSARRLPWRDRPDAYNIWVAEIMLQQTRVETVIPYFERWMSLFPTLQALAEADLQTVLAAWEGLGYYARARNLHRAARLVVQKYDGQLPSSIFELKSLPGIGDYTAGAIASIAFGLDEVAVDGNVRRVLARAFNLDIPARSPEGERRLLELARQHLPPGRAADYNQALMDLGATICTPRSPLCEECPLSELCLAKKMGLQAQRPIGVPRKEVPLYTVCAAVLRCGKRVLIAQRPQGGLLGGLWEFPGGKVQAGESLVEALKREILEELAVGVEVGAELGRYAHAYTHFRINLTAFECRLVNGASPQAREHTRLRWSEPDELINFPMGKVDRQIAQTLVARERDAYVETAAG